MYRLAWLTHYTSADLKFLLFDVDIQWLGDFVKAVDQVLKKENGG